MRLRLVSGISSGFPGLFQSLGQVTHVLLTRSPLITQEQALEVTVRLACVKHAASVRPEPGSNSPLMCVRRSRERGAANGKRSPDGNQLVDRQSRRNQTITVVCLTKGNPSRCAHEPKARRRPRGRGCLALTFGTLLSSQGADAHRTKPFGRVSGQPC